MRLFILLFMLVPATVMPGTTVGCQPLAPGIDLKIHVVTKPSSMGDSRITVLRIDPHLWELEFVGVSLTGVASIHCRRTLERSCVRRS